MRVITFDIAKGLYHFQISSIDTAVHQHPTLEIIISDGDLFSITSQGTEYPNLTLAVIDPNVPHQLLAPGNVQIVMIEFSILKVKSLLEGLHFFSKDGIYVSPLRSDRDLISELIDQFALTEEWNMEDERIHQVVQFLNQNLLNYDQLIPAVLAQVNLSESRLSHLFKEKMGVSLKKYLVWCRLKHAIQIHLGTKDDLLSALINSGFYDQPHFSKAFKEMLGISPSHAYNSRMLQG